MNLLLALYMAVVIAVCLIPFWPRIKAWVREQYEWAVYYAKRIPEPEWFRRMNLGEVVE